MSIDNVQVEATIETGPIGYSDLGLGLNNQKYALFGLFNKARSMNRPVVLPDFVIFDAKSEHKDKVPFSSVYSVDHLVRFAHAFGMEILDQPPIENDNGWHCFIGGTFVMGWEGKKGPGSLDDFTCQFFRSLVPHITSTPLFKKLARTIYLDHGIGVVAQLRIENDWLDVSKQAEATNSPEKDDYKITFLDILSKINYSIGNFSKKIYVVCDEANLPVSKEVIRETVASQFDISLIWKSDIFSKAELDQLSLLDLSIIDFEMSVRAPLFVGLSLSTFSNLACFETFCRTGTPATDHYIYNCPGPGLMRRMDFGAGSNLDDVANPIHLRNPLIPDTMNDCLWPISLTAHISKVGDFTTESGKIPGSRRGHIVCGIRGNSDIKIEGFILQSCSQLQVDLEYRAKTPTGDWGDWVTNGMLAGSRGNSQPINGFAVRLRGPLALSYEAICIGSFAGNHDLIQEKGHLGCASKNGESLEAMQIIFRPIVPEWPVGSN
ncbi:MAG TPA: hypothetical protein PK231_01975 [Acidocella sp.]|nr:hypothetical protein [Acidocella sp.]